MAQVLYGLQSVFSLWMIVDAAQRGAARYWYPVIFLPGGPIAYFFMVKMHDHQFRDLRNSFSALFKPKVTLVTLRFRVAETPSFANKLALAQGLFDAQLYAEAASTFEAVLKQDDESKDALYGFALCQLELEDYPRAIAALEHLNEIKPSFRDYDGWMKLALAFAKSDRPQAALGVIAELVRKAPWFAHRVTYAGYLLRDRQTDKAREQLQLGLQSYEHATRFQRRQDAPAAKKARAMLAQLDTR